jgi:hypothetical protein
MDSSERLMFLSVIAGSVPRPATANQRESTQKCVTCNDSVTQTDGRQGSPWQNDHAERGTFGRHAACDKLAGANLR